MTIEEAVAKAEAANCYKCEFRGTIPGSAHSKCEPANITKIHEQYYLLTHIPVIEVNEKRVPAVKFDPAGIRNGWALWPINFDPVWLRHCFFYKEKNANI
jgi:hypothetical protein